MYPVRWSAVSRRIEIELTSARDDGSWTWRAAGAREPRGVRRGIAAPVGFQHRRRPACRRRDEPRRHLGPRRPPAEGTARPNPSGSSWSVPATPSSGSPPSSHPDARAETTDDRGDRGDRRGRKDGRPPRQGGRDDRSRGRDTQAREGRPAKAAPVRRAASAAAPRGRSRARAAASALLGDPAPSRRGHRSTRGPSRSGCARTGPIARRRWPSSRPSSSRSPSRS